MATNYFRCHLLVCHIGQLPNDCQFMNSMKLVIPFHEKTHEIKCDGIASFHGIHANVPYKLDVQHFNSPQHRHLQTYLLGYFVLADGTIVLNNGVNQTSPISTSLLYMALFNSDITDKSSILYNTMGL